MSHQCPIARCPFPVGGPLRICREHYRLVPRPQQDALAHYARTRKGGPAHIASFERAVESVEKTIAARTPKPADRPTKPAYTPYRDD